METEGERILFDSFELLLFVPNIENILAYIAILILLVCSALISGSEVAFFSLKTTDLAKLQTSENSRDKIILNLLIKHRHLLATILISNNFINIGIIILSSFTLDKTLVVLALADWMVFLINVVFVTFVLVLFGEIAPKVYANLNSIKLARLMAKPLQILGRIFKYPSDLLVKSTSIIERKLEKQTDKEEISIEELEHAIELTMQGEEENETTIEQETNVLKNILHFGNSTVKQAMRSRLDVLAIDIQISYFELLDLIKKNNYSRIPVYEKQLDEIKGVLYVKDLIQHINESNDFAWQTLIRPPFVIYEDEKLEDLLHIFKSKRIHLAIVVDRDYGGVSGIITMEDVLEEVTGDIEDEFDEPLESLYLKFGDNVYILEGKTLLNDVCRITDIDIDTFEDVQDEVDSLAGLVIQLADDLPVVNACFTYKQFIFEPVAVNDRTVTQVKMTITDAEELYAQVHS
ncbi:MAG: gliding motility-associated protein GldE [Saprospiraceae bacterium]